MRSRDGTEIHGFMVKPPGYQPGRRYPTILRIHGGPVYQFYHDFANLDWQVLAATGYVVLAVNPRGSSGRGEKFSTAIWAKWGQKDGEDVLAAVDWAVKQGIADPDRLGVGGWSYGGILTNEVIARDQRFKAATSGAGQGNALLGYGTDQYVKEYEAELGTPWKNPKAYLEVSYPFLHADRITHADAVPLRRPGLERAAGQLRADVPGAQEPRPGDAARGLSGRVALAGQAQPPAGPDGAIPGVVREVPGRRGRTGGDAMSAQRAARAVGLSLLVALTVLGCRKRDAETSPTPDPNTPVPVEIESHFMGDVTVYLVRGNLRQRLGMVTGSRRRSSLFRGDG